MPEVDTSFISFQLLFMPVTKGMIAMINKSWSSHSGIKEKYGFGIYFGSEKGDARAVKHGQLFISRNP